MTATAPPEIETRPRWAPASAEPTAAEPAWVTPETATVIAGGVEPQVLLSSGETLPLRWALPYEARLEPGDALQVLRRGQRCYAIGVLRSSGGFRLQLSDRAELRGFRLRLVGDRGLKLMAPDVRLKARQLLVDAVEVAERVGNASRRVLGRLQIRARNARTVVDGEHHVRAKQRRGVAATAHRLDGNLVQFGQ